MWPIVRFIELVFAKTHARRAKSPFPHERERDTGNFEVAKGSPNESCRFREAVNRAKSAIIIQRRYRYPNCHHTDNPLDCVTTKSLSGREQNNFSIDWTNWLEFLCRASQGFVQRSEEFAFPTRICYPNKDLVDSTERVSQRAFAGVRDLWIFGSGKSSRGIKLLHF